ncbi:MAG: FAD-dependent oxidoreductase [Actinomycetota bacterium]
MTLPRGADVVVIGAGVVGAACAAALSAAGLDVCVVDRVGPSAGSTSSGEGNLLISDKMPGPELDLALHSLALWRLFATSAPFEFEFEAKGSLVVTTSDPAQLERTAAAQRDARVDARPVDAAALRELEPMLSPDVSCGVLYPQDSQLQPMRAVRALMAGTRLVLADVVGAQRDRGGTIAGVHTSRGPIATRCVVVAAGAWSGEVSRALGGAVRVLPRRGHVVVTEPLPSLVRHKVYEAGYVADVQSDDGSLLSSPVVEGTPSGPLLLGSSRELVGFDTMPNPAALAAITAGAIRLFPFLRDVRALRSYLGFRPASPDHLPIVGEESPGLWYATGHEGAGIGLAMGTADLITALITGASPAVDPAPFSPLRPAVRSPAVPPAVDQEQIGAAE